MVTETTHVIFDLDGTLVNSVDVFCDVLKDHARGYGKDVSLELIKKVPNIADLPVFFNEYFDSLALNEEFDRKKVMEEMIQTFFRQKFQLIAGVERLVTHLHKHNIPMAIATGNSKRHYTILSRQLEESFKNCFKHVICGWDDPKVVNKKPHPDVYFVCADQFESKPKDIKNVLIIEDSLTGISGAVSTGMKTLLINDQKLCDFSQMADKITLISDSYEDFKPESIGLPAYH